MKKIFMVTAILATASGLGFAKELSPIELEQTVVTSESFGTSTHRTAKNIQVITAKEMEEKGALTVDEALKGVPGVMVRKMDGGTPVIDLRGSGAASSFSSSILLLDGVPLNGLVKLDINSIPLSEISRIEIIQGGGAVMYGDGSTGGVVNIITKSPKYKKHYGSAGLEYGSWKTSRASLNYGTALTDKLSVSASYSGYASMEYRDRGHGKTWSGESFDYRNKKDKKYSLWLQGKYQLEDGSIGFKYNHNERKDYYTGYLEKKQYEENPKQIGSYSGKIQDVTDIYNLSYQTKLTDTLEFLVYGGYYRGKSINQNQLTSEYFIKPQFKYTYGENSYVILGGDYRDGKREFKEKVLVNGRMQKAPNDERESKAIYVMNKTSLGNWEFSQGYRYEKVDYKYSSKIYAPDWSLSEIKPMSSKYSHNDSFELGVNYLYSDTGNVYFNYTKAMRTPTIGEAGAWYGDVKTQKNDIFEIGLRDYFKNTQISSSIFYITSKNEVYYDKTNPNNSNNRNFDGRVRRTGAQLSLTHYLDKLSVRERISYIHPKVSSGIYSGKTFAGVPKWTLNLGATYHVTDKFLVNTDLYYQSKAYAEDDFDNYFKKDNSYATLDINTSYAFENGMEVYGGVKNVFDKKYANTITSSRSTWSPGPRTVFYPADGKSVYVGFKYHF